MAKVVIRNLQSLSLDVVKAFYDEIAEDCPLLAVSAEGNTTLILTIDTDVVLSMLCYANGNIGSRSVSINGNNIVSSGSTQTVISSPKVIVAYTEDFFLTYIYSGLNYSTSGCTGVLYEKISGTKMAYGCVSGIAGSTITNLRDRDNNSISRATFSSQYNNLPGYLDYTDNTILTKSGNRYDFDTNFIYVLSQGTLQGNIITFNNQDYFAITNQYLIPIDPE